MRIHQSLLFVALLPCLSSGSIFNRRRQSVNNVIHFRQDGRQKPGDRQTGMQSDKPDFCNKLDCPEFTVIKNEKTYQLREYVATKWVSTNSVGISFDAAQYTDFERLFQYISGKNAKGQKIAMTAPVIDRIIPGPGPACESNFTMSFFVSPKEGQPPQPTDKTVFLSSMPKMRVYVRSFGGFASEKKWIEEAAALADALGSAAYVKDYYYTAGYNSPFQLTNRHNEIWFLAQ
ncbi:hypothetical protein BaRGS_00013228 [Batillaria attramentaria]|uniref:Heme-binding protein 2 n=1 Tax=Batillaria attramentaria TaxID=370345 RepID=A0ABD0L868_9CAEN